MSKLFVFFAMIFCHIIDDYVLQTVGPLATMKQKNWWKDNYPQELYKHDYLVALLMHSLSWAFMMMLPVAWYMSWNVGVEYAVLFVLNTLLHAIIDHLKANRLAINLIADQLLHLGQIAGTFWLLMF